MQSFNSIDFSNKKVLIRVDFNVPLDDQFEVSDNSRIMASLETINEVLKANGKVILMSHLGRPNGREERFSLKHIIPELEKQLGQQIAFDDLSDFNKSAERSNALNPGEVLLLENLRFYEEEKKGDHEFAKKLAGLCDIYINDAFGTAHRAHASTAIIAEYASVNCFGLLMEKEIQHLNKVLENSERPVTAIIGGAKVSSKLGVIQNLMGKCDNLIIGGGMAYTFIKAQGGNIGNSLFEEDKIEDALDILEVGKRNKVNILLPSDTIAATAFSNEAESKTVAIDSIPDNWMGLDIGDSSIQSFRETILASKTILWNGPMGVFEFENFSKGTVQIALAISEASQSGAYSLVGGGDSVAALKKFDLDQKVSYVSTGGGAMLEFMEGKILPGIAAIQD